MSSMSENKLVLKYLVEDNLRHFHRCGVIRGSNFQNYGTDIVTYTAINLRFARKIAGNCH